MSTNEPDRDDVHAYGLGQCDEDVRTAMKADYDALNERLHFAGVDKATIAHIMRHNPVRVIYMARFIREVLNAQHGTTALRYEYASANPDGDGFNPAWHLGDIVTEVTLDQIRAYAEHTEYSAEQLLAAAQTAFAIKHPTGDEILRTAEALRVARTTH